MSEASSGRRARHDAPIAATTKIGYASGALLDGIAQQAVSIFLFFYVTAVCGVPAGLAGVALAAGLVVDGVVDPLIGSLSDGWRSRFGRRLPFMALGLPATMIFLVLIFSLPRGLGGGALLAWLMFLSIGLRVSMSLFLLPFTAVGAEVSDDYAERSSIAAWRWGFSMIGGLCAVVLGFGVFLSGPTGLSDRDAYTPFSFALAAIATIGALVAMWATAAMRDRQFAPADPPRAAHAALFEGLGEIMRNPSFRTLFVGAILLFTSLSIHSTLGLHANNYFWHLSAAQIQSVTLGLFAGLLFGAPLAGPMLKRMEKRTVLLIGMLGLAAAFSIPTTLQLLGLFPFRDGALVAILAASVFVGGLLMAAAAIACASMMADAADEHEHLFGARREGLYFAGWALAAKVAAGLGSLVAGLALQAIGFPSGARAVAHATLHPSTVAWIGVIYGPGASLIAVFAAGTCLFYRLDAARHAGIMRDLEGRRGRVADVASVVA